MYAPNPRQTSFPRNAKLHDLEGCEAPPMEHNLLDTLKESLRSMENVRAVNPNEPHLVRLKQNLRRRIAELEGTASTEPTNTRL